MIIGWLAVSGIGGPYFGRISDVAVNDQSVFLPESAESTRAQEEARSFRDSDAVPAILVITERENGDLSQDALARTTEAVEAIAEAGLLDGDASPPIPSDDGRAAQVFLPIGPEQTADDVDAVRALLAEELPDDLLAQVTGPAGFSADLSEAFSGIDGLLLLVALIAVFVILVIVYRSPLLPVLVLLTSLGALSASILVVYTLADAGLVTVNGQVQGILFILVVGAATDYSLLYTARYREALLDEPQRLRATLSAWKGTVEPVAASAGTVIAGLLCLLLSDLSSNKALGPVAATGIAMAVLAAMTFLPALLLLFGRAAFWPRRPSTSEASARVRITPDDLPEGRGVEVAGRGVWASIARLVARRTRVVLAVTALLLLIPALFTVQLRSSGVPQSELVLGASEARDGQAVLAEHFDAGSGTPATVLADAEDATAVRAAAEGVEGVAEVSEPEEDTATGRVLMEATLDSASDSARAESSVAALRTAVHAAGADVLVGGETAVNVDTTTTAEHDRTLIIPVVLAVITLILMLLLRSVLAPLLLLATTVLSFGTALGVSALVFNHVLGFPGSDPSVPLYGFVFLVALGIDYNIFLMTRVREEAQQHGTRSGTLRGLVFTGGVITSAGIVLAATFAALAVIPIMFLVQLAFLVAFGVLVDALLVRSLLVPALAFEIGPRLWWPWSRRLDARQGMPRH